MNAFLKLLNVLFIYSTLAILGIQASLAQECNLNDTPTDFSLYSTISKKNKIRSVPTLNLRYEMLQFHVAFEAMPEGIKNCFLSMKQMSSQINAEVGAFIVLFDNGIEPYLQPLGSNQKRSISGVDIQNAFQTILNLSNKDHIKKIILSHTHPAGSDSIPFHSPNDAHLEKTSEDFFTQKLGHKVIIESAVLPLHAQMADKFVVGYIVEAEDYGH